MLELLDDGLVMLVVLFRRCGVQAFSHFMYDEFRKTLATTRRETAAKMPRANIPNAKRSNTRSAQPPEPTLSMTDLGNGAIDNG